MTTSAIRDLFSPDPGLTYVDAATYGLPPQPTVDALTRALAEWQAGTGSWVKHWEGDGDACRRLFAELIGAKPSEIALIPTVSVGIGMIAASLPAGTRVLLADSEFPSVLNPFLVAKENRGITVSEGPFGQLQDSIDDDTDLVALSLTQAHTGQTAPLAAICAAAQKHGARVLLDATHSIPFVSVKEHLGSIDYLICHGYKHLLCPRGVSFLYVREDALESVQPVLSNWRSAKSVNGGFLPHADASRFDVSLAWHSWVGARPSLELLVKWQEDGALASVLDLSARLATGLELPAPTSSIVCVTVPDAEAAVAALSAARVQVAARGTNIRIAPHVYNTTDDIDRTINAVNSVRG